MKQEMKQGLDLAFDVGHSSIGWAVLQTNPSLEIKGCGAVIFRADDCLASARRGYRRQRRHIRSTRQRIARVKRLIAHLGVLTEGQLNRPGCAWPWKLAARVLCGGKPLTWPELWDVLRWYAHNRGYDGNRRWSHAAHDFDGLDEAALSQLANDASLTEDEKDDAKKVKEAKRLMRETHTATMAETFCKVLKIDPLGAKNSSTVRFKGLNAAFPRRTVEREVQRILQAHFGKLPGVDEDFARALCGRDANDKDAWKAIPWFTEPLPKRYEGGLLFGQLVPRFDNRIISTCPITSQKVPSRNTPEFLNFRWGMLLANVRVARLGHTDLKPLTPDERKELDKRMRTVGSMTEKQFKDAVRDVSGAIRGNFDAMFMEVNQKEALILDPVQDCLTSGHAAPLFPTLPERIQKRARGQLRRGKTLTLGEYGKGIPAFDAEVHRIIDRASGKGRKKDKALTREAILSERLAAHKLSGRAAYSRPILRKAFEEVMAGRHPKEEGGCLFVTEQMRQAQLNRSLAEQTNNHLVRHRLLILERLLRDIIKEYAAGDKAGIRKVTVEVNRDLQEFSGLDVQGKAKLQGLKLSNHKKVSAKLEAVLSANNRLDAMSASLIRKARIADDLGCVCPYVGPKKPFEMIDLVNNRVDLDHIVPKTERQSDSLDSLVVTYSEINKWKGKRTAWQFVRDEQGKQVPGRPDLSIQSLAHYEKFVISLPPDRDPFKRQMDNERRFLDDDKRRWRRKKLLLLPEYTGKTFTPRDLTQTSQITRLAQQTILKRLDHLAPYNVIPIPGSLTGLVRKAWEILGCLNLACPQAEGRNKTEIRDITHLHHAMDACVLGLTSHFIPNDGRVWELIGKRSLDPAECRELDMLGIFDFNDKRLFRLRDLDKGIKEQIRQRLAEKRVVQHIPKRMHGLHVEQNTWRVRNVENGDVTIEQRIRQPDGKRPLKQTVERTTKLLGLEKGKLAALKGALVVGDNFGVALDPTPTVIPFHKVWPRLMELKAKNGGKTPRVLRNGQLIQVPSGRYRGTWRIFSAKNNRRGIAVDMAYPDVIRPENGVEGHKINVLLSTLLRDGMTILNAPLTGVASPPSI